MIITNFEAILKIMKWTSAIHHNTLIFEDPTDQIFIRIHKNYIVIGQYVQRSDNTGHDILCECENLDETLDYIINLDMNTLPPNGK